MVESIDRIVTIGGEATIPLGDLALFSKVNFFDDFLGSMLKKIVTGENTTALWTTVETQLNLAIGNVADATNGVVQLTLDSDDIAQVACLYFGDSEQFLIGQGLIFEARVTMAVLCATGTEEVEAAFGLAGEHNADLDTVDIKAWFRTDSPAGGALKWESDDDTTADEDNATGITIVAGTYNIFKIDASDISNVMFFVDDVLVGTADMSALDGTLAKVQPYFQLSKAVSSANTGVATMNIDWVKITQDRE